MIEKQRAVVIVVLLTMLGMVLWTIVALARIKYGNNAPSRTETVSQQSANGLPSMGSYWTLKWMHAHPTLSRPQVEEQFTGPPLSTEQIQYDSSLGWQNGTRSIYRTLDKPVAISYNEQGYMINADYAP